MTATLKKLNRNEIVKLIEFTTFGKLVRDDKSAEVDASLIKKGWLIVKRDHTLGWAPAALKGHTIILFDTKGNPRSEYIE